MKAWNGNRRQRSAGWKLASALAAACLATGAQAEPPRNGEQVYDAVCIACHGTGKDDAPRLGDKAKWGPLIKEGQHVLTAHGWVGVRKMPPKGGDEKLGIEEFARAAAYMARAAGGDWKDPDEKMMKRIRAEEKKRIEDLRKKGK